MGCGGHPWGEIGWAGELGQGGWQRGQAGEFNAQGGLSGIWDCQG